MKTLVIVHHGRWDKDSEKIVDGEFVQMGLTEKGQDDIKAITQLLKPYLEGQKVVVLASMLDAAVKSAELLCLELGISEFKKHLELFSCWTLSYMEPLKVADVSELLKRYLKNDVVVIVNDFRFSRHFAPYFAKNFLRRELKLFAWGWVCFS